MNTERTARLLIAAARNAGTLNIEYVNRTLAEQARRRRLLMEEEEDALWWRRRERERERSHSVMEDV